MMKLMKPSMYTFRELEICPNRLHKRVKPTKPISSKIFFVTCETKNKNTYGKKELINIDFFFTTSLKSALNTLEILTSFIQ